MSVDLGLRVTYSYSVMEIVAEKGTGFCYEMRDFLTGDKLYALHERSGQIRLIGDKPSHLVELKRGYIIIPSFETLLRLKVYR